MAIELASQFLPYVDEMFAAESKTSLLTNQDFSWDGGHCVKVYRVSTAGMNDYARAGGQSGFSRYGAVEGLDATTQSMTLRKDRSFTFAIDKLDEDETKQALAAANALARQLREVVIPEVDANAYGEMCKGAGHQGAPAALTADNIYDKVIEASAALDDAEVPETGRVLVVSPEVYLLLKKNRDVVLEADIGQAMRLRGVIGLLDGAAVVKVPRARLPEKFGFLLAHPCATVAPVKLADYKIHRDPPGISGSLVEGRVNYDAFVLDNKKAGLFYQAKGEEEAAG